MRLTCSFVPSRRLAALATAALAIGLLPSGAAAADVDGPASSGAVDCVSATDDEADAAAVATACSTAVEVLDARTPWDTLIAQGDGTMRWVSSATAVRTEVGGEWTDIDNAVVHGDGGLVVAAPVTAMTFSDGTAGAPLARLGRDGHELAFDVPVELPAPTVDGARITYADVLPGVDLLVTVNADATGFSEVLRVASPEAAADPRIAELTFPVEVSDGLEVAAESGGFVATDAAGQVVFSSPTPAMWDSSSDAQVSPPSARRALADASLPGGTPADAAGITNTDPVAGPTAGDAVAWMPAEVSDDTVTIVPDAELLTGADTVWPVYIDPSVTGSRNQWTAVRDVFGAKWAFSPDEGVGLCSRATSTSCSATFKSRLLWTFTGLGTIGALSANQIVSATFTAVATHSYDCTARPVTLFRTGDFSSGTGWPGGSLWEPMSTQTFAAKSTCAGQPVRRIEFDATPQARAIADANTAQGSVGLAADESSMAYWKRFQNDAEFWVVYNRPPSTPTTLRVTAGSVTKACGSTVVWMNSATPTLRAVVADPDGGNVQANFDLYSGATAVFNPGLTTGKASGAEHTQAVTVTLSKNATYQMRVNAQDPQGLTSAVASCSFGVDTTAPDAPTVAPVGSTSYPAVYPEGAWSGGLGQAGAFTFASASTDVLSYKYSFNDTALTQTASGATSTVAFTPTGTGTQTLRVQAVDRAGNVSAVKLYTFNVTIPTSNARWSLDDGAGTVATDSSGFGNRYPLAMTETTGWTDGPLGDDDSTSSDRALLLDSPEDGAAASGPVLATQMGFTVGATVRLDQTPAGSRATIVSQDGAAASGFELGYRADGGCEDGAPACWSFSMRGTGAANAVETKVTSSALTGVGDWVYVAGVFNERGNTIGLYLCSLDGSTEVDRLDGPEFRTEWNAAGALRVGQNQQLGSSAWAGAVADVQVLSGPADVNQLRRACHRTFDDTVVVTP